MDYSQEPTPIIRRPLHEEATDRLRQPFYLNHLAQTAAVVARLPRISPDMRHAVL